MISVVFNLLKFCYNHIILKFSSTWNDPLFPFSQVSSASALPNKLTFNGLGLWESVFTSLKRLFSLVFFSRSLNEMQKRHMSHGGSPHGAGASLVGRGQCVLGGLTFMGTHKCLVACRLIHFLTELLSEPKQTESDQQRKTPDCDLWRKEVWPLPGDRNTNKMKCISNYFRFDLKTVMCFRQTAW